MSVMTFPLLFGIQFFVRYVVPFFSISRTVADMLHRVYRQPLTCSGRVEKIAAGKNSGKSGLTRVFRCPRVRTFRMCDVAGSNTGTEAGAPPITLRGVQLHDPVRNPPCFGQLRIEKKPFGKILELPHHQMLMVCCSCCRTLEIFARIIPTKIASAAKARSGYPIEVARSAMTFEFASAQI